MSERTARAPLPPGFSVIWTTVAIDLVGFGIVLPILPLYAEDLGARATMVGLLVASFSLAQMVCAPLLGRLSDRIGRKPVLIISLLGTAVGSLVTGLAGSVAVLFVGRIIDGASGASVSVAQAAATDLAEPRDRPRVLGLLGAAFGIGFVVGPMIGALASLGGAHVPFFVAAAIALVNAAVAVKRLPETHPAHAVPAVAPEPAPTEGAPALPPSMRQAIVRVIVVSFVGVAAFSGFEATFALLGQDRFGLESASIGIVFAGIGVALAIVQGALVGPVSQRLGETAVLRGALVLNVVGLGLLAIGGGWLGLVAALGLLVVGQGLLTPNLSTAVADRAGDARGSWLGWQQSAGAGARVVGPLMAGALFEHVGVGAPYALAAGLTVVALALVPA